MSEDKREMSDVAIAMSVFFKRSRQTTPTADTPTVRQRLESSDSSTESPITKLFSRHEKAERNRTKFMESRLRALSDADEQRLQKMEAVMDEREKKAERIQRSQNRAAANRTRLLSQRSARLKRRHSMIENQLCERKDDEQEARTQLSVVFERRGRETAFKREERIKYIAKRAREFNEKVAEALEKAKIEEQRKKQELREQWEEKIERAREKRQQLLQAKINGM